VHRQGHRSRCRLVIQVLSGCPTALPKQESYGSWSTSKGGPHGSIPGVHVATRSPSYESAALTTELQARLNLLVKGHV
jgi:hypothetical protein